MIYKFLIAGFMSKTTAEGIIPDGDMKSQSRRASHQVSGAEDKVGPSVRFERYGRIITRPLTCRELVFGVKAPNDGKGGGFAGLVTWVGYEGLDLQSEVRINMARARIAGASDWIVQFVREIIRTAGWTIVSEEGAEASCYLK